MVISSVKAREVLDSRGNPTVEAEVYLNEGIYGKGISPSGASTGKFEALELRDNDAKRYFGKGVTTAVANVNSKINELIQNREIDYKEADRLMIEKDATKDKSALGANAMLAVSIACADAQAKSQNIPIYKLIGGNEALTMPIPMMNILNGGVHAANTVDFQEFMIMPTGACCFKEALRMGSEIYHALADILKKEGLSTAVGDEGGFAPDLKDAFEVFEYLKRAVQEAGYKLGKDIVFAMDAAASELYNEDSGIYYFAGESRLLEKERMKCLNLEKEQKAECNCSIPDSNSLSVSRSTDEMIEYYEKLCEKYPIASIEDPLNEEDWEGWIKLTQKLGDKVLLVGDDLFVTNTERLKKGIEKKAGNAILIKLNQIGTVSETLEAIDMAKKAGFKTIISHRSGETEDTFIADLAVGVNAGQIKTGAPCRSDRVAKYNRLLRIEEELADKAKYNEKCKKK